LKLPKMSGCTVSMFALFEHEGVADMGEFDTCREKTVRFTDWSFTQRSGAEGSGPPKGKANGRCRTGLFICEAVATHALIQEMMKEMRACACGV
jgi:hypothetical protein